MPANFVDITAKVGIPFWQIASHTAMKYLPETMGSGVALFDYDNDGRLDIFVVNGAPIGNPTAKGTIPKKSGPADWNRLYHQKPDGSFEDVTARAGLQGVGYGMGVAVGDFNNDGYDDLYVTAYGGNKLYRNNGDGTFTEVTENSHTGGSGWSTSAAWVDLDNDGLLDLVGLRYMQWDFDDVYCGEHIEGYRAYCYSDIFPEIAPLVYHNDGGGRFTKIAEKSGLAKPQKGLESPSPTTIATARSTSSSPMIRCRNSYFTTKATEPSRRLDCRRRWPSMATGAPMLAWGSTLPTATTMGCQTSW